MNTFLDMLPSHEKRKLKKRLPPGVYEKLREKVKGPEDLEKELGHMEKLANLKFNIESEPEVKQKLKDKIREDISAQGIEEVLEGNIDGDFDISVEENPDTNEDQLVVLPEGNVSERIAVRSSFSDKYLGMFG